MRKYRQEIKTTDLLVSITCDVCKKTFEFPKDEMEIQEFQAIHFVGGYDSVFGDGNQIECDVCQHCLKKVLGEYLRYNGEGNEQEE